MAFDADAYVSDLTYQELQDLILYGPNLATSEERSAAIAAAKRAQSAIAPTQVPTGPGMGDNGYQQGVTPVAPPPDRPGGNLGTIEIPIPEDATPPIDNNAGNGNQGSVPFVPPTNGMGPDGGQLRPANDTGWDWAKVSDDLGGVGWGGELPDYNVNTQYQPGQDSPWGNPEREGGNEEFYAQQFGNLLNETQDFQRRQREAAAQMPQSQARPQQPAADPWSWVNGGAGLPEVSVDNKGYTPPTSSFTPTTSGYNNSNAPDYFYNPSTGQWEVNGAGSGSYVPTPGGGGGIVDNGIKPL